MAEEKKTTLEEAAISHLDSIFGKGKHDDFYIQLFIAGAEWKEQDMLKDAVKGTVCKDKKCVWIELIPNALPDYEDIEPVKCVVVRED